MTVPRSRTAGPRYACSCTTERTIDASCFMTTSRPRTVYSRTCAPASIRQLDPMIAGPSMRASGSTSAPFAEPDVLAEPEPVDLEVDLALEDVLVRAQVRLERADVLPVAVGDVAEQRLAPLQDRREHVTGEVDDLALRDEVEHLGLEHVDAGVDRVREDLAPGRLLEEPLDRAVVVRDDDAELDRVVDPLQRDRTGRTGRAVRLHERAEVDVGEHVAGDDEERLVELVGRVAHRARRAERRVLGGVPHAHAEVRAVTEVRADVVREERDRHDDVVEAVLGEQADDVLHHRPVRDGHHRLRLVAGQRPEAGALSPGEDHCLHVHHLTSGAAVLECGAGHRDVERGGVVAEDESANREEPGDDLDDVARRAGIERRDEHETGEGEHQGQRARFSDPLHIDPAGSGRGEDQGHDAQRRFAPEDQDPHPERDVPADQQADRAGDEHDPVRDRIEDLADLAALVEVAGDVAVDPVRRAEHREQDPGRDRPILAEQEPEEHGDPGEPSQGDGVRDGPDPAVVRDLRGRHGPKSRRHPASRSDVVLHRGAGREDRPDRVREQRPVHRMVPIREVVRRRSRSRRRPRSRGCRR